jgi:ABC-type sugar transport system ATPase subunit
MKFVETLGWESYVHLRLGEETILAQIPSERAAALRPEEKLSLTIRPEDLLLFDPESGAALLQPIDEELAP